MREQLPLHVYEKRSHSWFGMLSSWKKKKMYNKLKSKTEMKMNADDFKLNILNCKCGNTDSNSTISLNSIRGKALGDSHR